MSADPARPPWPVYASVFLISFAVLAFEVALTRIFSVLFSYHFVFLAVSGAICGLGVGGFGWHMLGLWVRRESLNAGWAALGFALLMPASIVTLFGAASLLSLSPWASLIVLVPFACAGAFLAEAFRQRASDSGRLYQADLAGAAIAAVVVVPLIGFGGALYVVFALGAIAALAAVAWGLVQRHGVLLMASAVTSLLLFIAWPLSAGTGVLQLRPLLRPAEDIEKDLVRQLADTRTSLVVDTEWTAYARTDFIRYDLADEGIYDLQLYTDGGTSSTMVPFKGDLGQVVFLKADLPYLAFDLSPHGSLLSIGPGGGMDLLWGKLAGFGDIQGVEINDSVARLMDRYRRINGDLYHQPGISVAIEDGRSFVRRTNRQYDLISSSLTQTATTSTVGLSLVESYIHTQQAFEDYYRHLTPNGRYAIVTQRQPLLMRAALTAIAVMQANGISATEACGHLIAAAVPNAETLPSPYRYLLIWKKSPVTAADLAPFLRAARMGTVTPIYLPGVPSDSMLADIARGEMKLAQALSVLVTEDGFPVSIRPVTDDRPFFLDLTPGVPGMLLWFVVVSFGAAAVYSAALLARRGRTREKPHGWVLYFGALGVGFMLVEIPLIQKLILLLGRPILSLTAILFYLLIGASVGSRISQSWPLDGLHRRVGVTGLVICTLALLYSAALGSVVNAALPLPLFAKLILLGLLALPVGLALGIPFPSGLRLMSRDWQAEIPWMWGVNGLMSVVGSGLAVATAKLVGFNACLLTAAAIYAAVGASMLRAGSLVGAASTAALTSAVPKRRPRKRGGRP